MVQQFLSFVDKMTNFGRIHLSGDTLFTMFCVSRRLNEKHTNNFRHLLESRGIL